MGSRRWEVNPTDIEGTHDHDIFTGSVAWACQDTPSKVKTNYFILIILPGSLASLFGFGHSMFHT